MAKVRLVLKNLKWKICSMETLIEEAKLDQAKGLTQINRDPHNNMLHENIKDINLKYNELVRKESLWVK